MYISNYVCMYVESSERRGDSMLCAAPGHSDRALRGREWRLFRAHRLGAIRPFRHRHLHDTCGAFHAHWGSQRPRHARRMLATIAEPFLSFPTPHSHSLHSFLSLSYTPLHSLTLFLFLYSFLPFLLFLMLSLLLLTLSPHLTHHFPLFLFLVFSSSNICFIRHSFLVHWQHSLLQSTMIFPHSLCNSRVLFCLIFFHRANNMQHRNVFAKFTAH